MGQKGFTFWFTGLSGAGKTTLARLVETELKARGQKVEVLDGDVIRTNLSKGLGFSKEDRDTNIRRIGFVCDLLTRNDVVAIAAAISPYRESAKRCAGRSARSSRSMSKCPIDVLAERDVKGLYKKALAGEIKNFTGVDDPYEEPASPEVTVETDSRRPSRARAESSRSSKSCASSPLPSPRATAKRTRRKSAVASKRSATFKRSRRAGMNALPPPAFFIGRNMGLFDKFKSKGPSSNEPLKKEEKKLQAGGWCWWVSTGRPARCFDVSSKTGRCLKCPQARRARDACCRWTRRSRISLRSRGPLL